MQKVTFKCGGGSGALAAADLRRAGIQLLKRHCHVHHHVGNYFGRSVTRQLQRTLYARVHGSERVALRIASQTLAALKKRGRMQCVERATCGGSAGVGGVRVWEECEACDQVCCGGGGGGYRAKEALEQRQRCIQGVFTTGFHEAVGILVVRSPALQVAQHLKRLKEGRGGGVKRKHQQATTIGRGGGMRGVAPGRAP